MAKRPKGRDAKLEGRQVYGSQLHLKEEWGAPKVQPVPLFCDIFYGAIVKKRRGFIMRTKRLRLLSAILALAMMLTLMPTAAFAATSPATTTEGNWTYYVNEDGKTVTITKYNGNEIDVIVPAELGGKTVTALADATSSSGGVFYEKYLTGVVIPNSLKRIGDYSFYHTRNLTTIKYGDKTNNSIMPTNSQLESIGKYAFSLSMDFNSIELPDTLTEIGEGAFYNCQKIESFKFPNSVKKIENKTFAYCENLVMFDVPSQVVEIGEQAFAYCKDLMEVTGMENVKVIGQEAFSNSGLETFVFPELTSRSVPERAFLSCPKLVSVSIPNDL